MTVTHREITRFIMSIPEAYSLILDASSYATDSEIFVFDMGKEHKIWKLAERIIHLAGLESYKDIVETELRPGEKPYEEVLASDENTTKTSLDKVMIAKPPPENYTDINPIFEKMEQAAQQVEKKQSVRLLKELISEYSRANSEFEALDKK